MEKNIQNKKLDQSKLLGFISTAKVGGKPTAPLQAKVGSKVGFKD